MPQKHFEPLGGSVLSGSFLKQVTRLIINMTTNRITTTTGMVTSNQNHKEGYSIVQCVLVEKILVQSAIYYLYISTIFIVYGVIQNNDDEFRVRLFFPRNRTFPY